FVRRAVPRTTRTAPPPPTLPAPIARASRKQSRLERAHGAQDIVRIRAHLEVVAHREPADDAVLIQHHGGGTRHVLAIGSAAGVDQAIAAGHGVVRVGEESITKTEPIGYLLSLLVAIGWACHALL